MKMILWTCSRARYFLSIALLISVYAGSNAQAANWWESTKVKGDFRYRHEMIDEAGKEIRNRQRIRARISIYAEVSAYTNIGIRLASGSDDPVSTNQTLGDAGSSKQIGIDLAYFQTSFKKLPGLNLVGGKMKNPFVRPGSSELIWDSDWNPEGGALNYSGNSGDVAYTITSAGLWLVERSSDKNSYIVAVQGMLNFGFKEIGSGLKIGGSFFNFANTRGFQPFFDKDDSFGNSLSVVNVGGNMVNVYANDYELMELFGEVSGKIGDIPLSVMGDFVTNRAADSMETGWSIGISVGKTKKPGSWQVRYNYKRVERDAVLGLLTDSDFIGGGTDGKGHEIGGAVQLAKNTALHLTYFINEIGIDTNMPIDFSRLQADIQMKF